MLKNSLKLLSLLDQDTVRAKISETCYTVLVVNTTPIEELVSQFKKKGGVVNRYYLLATNKNKQALVYLKGWHKGSNIREAIKKALSLENLQ